MPAQPLGIGPRRRGLEGAPPDEMRCYRCGETKPVEEFARDRSKASGRKSLCKACDNAKSKDYYAANRERVIERNTAARSRRAFFSRRVGGVGGDRDVSLEDGGVPGA
jgi:hypothetical protein